MRPVIFLSPTLATMAIAVSQGLTQERPDGPSYRCGLAKDIPNCPEAVAERACTIVIANVSYRKN
jgi:hypothetical protein